MRSPKLLTMRSPKLLTTNHADHGENFATAGQTLLKAIKRGIAVRQVQSSAHHAIAVATAAVPAMVDTIIHVAGKVLCF